MIFLVQRWLLYLWCVSSALGSLREREGWLERAVSFHRGRFLNDVREVAPAPARIQASLEPLPAAYADSARWDYAAVARLLALLGAPHCRAPRRALRRALQAAPLAAHTRRFISQQDSWKLFPSLNQHMNEIYYDSQPTSEEEVEEPPKGEGEWSPQYDDAIIVLQNPVEARLPSAQISVRLLREILEARAFAARQMPSTLRSTIPWITMSKTSIPGSSDGMSSDATPTRADGAATDAPPVNTDAPADKVTANDAPTDKVMADDALAGSTDAPKDSAPTTDETPAEDNKELRRGADRPPRSPVDADQRANSRVRRARPKSKLAKGSVARARAEGTQ